MIANRYQINTNILRRSIIKRGCNRRGK